VASWSLRHRRIGIKSRGPRASVLAFEKSLVVRELFVTLEDLLGRMRLQLTDDPLLKIDGIWSPTAPFDDELRFEALPPETSLIPELVNGGAT
jgi:hypothetical protein